MMPVMRLATLSYPVALVHVSPPHTCSRSPFPGPCGVLSLFTSSPLAFFRLLMAVACMISLMMFRLCGRQEVRVGCPEPWLAHMLTRGTSLYNNFIMRVKINLQIIIFNNAEVAEVIIKKQQVIYLRNVKIIQRSINNLQ